MFSDQAKAVNAAVQVAVRFSVAAQEQRAYTVENITLENTEVAQAMPMRFTVRNTGNTAVRMDKIVLTLRATRGIAQTLESVIPVSEIPIVEPFTTQVVTVYTSRSFPAGLYRGEVGIFEHNEEQGSVANIPVRVYPATSLAFGSKFLDASINKTKVKAGEKVTIEGTLKNVSKTPLQPVLYAVIHRRGLVLDVVRSVPLTVAPGQEAKVSALWRAHRAGDHVIETYFTYGAYETEHKELLVHVASRTPLLVYFIYLGIILLSCMIAYLLIGSWRA